MHINWKYWQRQIDTMIMALKNKLWFHMRALHYTHALVNSSH